MVIIGVLMQITQGLLTELNRLYTMFCDRHPYFEANAGVVSFIAHSLGEAPHICYLCNDIALLQITYGVHAQLET